MRINNYTNTLLIKNLNTFSINYNKSIERLSTGKKINKSADSPSQILKLNRLESQYKGNKVSQTNIKKGMLLLDTMDNALTNIKNISIKIRELKIQFKNGVLSNDEKNNIKNQTQELYEEINHILKNTTYDNIKVFGDENIIIQTGANQGDKYIINKPNLDLNKYISNEKKIENQLFTRSFYNQPLSLGITTKPHEDMYLKHEDVNIIDSKYIDDNTYVKTYENGWVVSTTIEDGIEKWSKVYKNDELVVEGNFENGKLNGYAKIYKDDEIIREGNYKNNKLNGWGEVVFSDGTSFAGNWENGEKKGWGTFFDENGNILEEKIWGDDGDNNNTTIPPNTDGDDDNTTIPPNTDGGDDNTTIPPNTDGGDDNTTIPPNTDGGDNNTTIPPNTDGDDDNNTIPPNTDDSVDIDIDIDELIKDVSILQSNIGINYNILEYRLSYQKNMEIINLNSYDNIINLDIAKELLESVKNQMLLEINSNLLHKNLNYHKDYIIQLLK